MLTDAMRDEIVWETGTGALARLEPEWADLARGRGPFATAHWFQAWREAFAPDGEERICTVRRDGRLVAGFPLVESGGEIGPMSNGHSPAVAPLAEDADALRALVAEALRAAGGELTLLTLPGDDPLRTLPRPPWRAIAAVSVHSPAVDTGGSFDDWRAGSKPRWGAPLERFRRKMARDHEAVTTTIGVPGDMPAFLERGFEVEASGWKGREGTAILSDEATARFYRRVAELFHERDGLRLSAIELDGEMAAFDLTLLHENRLYLLKTAFDERFRKLAPGLVMRLNIIESCFELGLASHEMLGDRSEWKSKFATTERTRVAWTGYGRSAGALGRYAYRRGSRSVKRGARAAARRLARSR